METMETINLCDNLLANMTVKHLGTSKDIGVVFKKGEHDSITAEVRNGVVILDKNIYQNIGEYIQKNIWSAIEQTLGFLPSRATGVAFVDGDINKPVFVFNYKFNRNNRGRTIRIKPQGISDYITFRNDVLELGDKVMVDFR